MEQQLALSRRGGVRHRQNPFISNTALNTRQSMRRVNASGDKMMVVNENTGEITSRAAGFWQTQEVDRTQFVKLYINGVKAFKELSGAGTKVFELLYLKVQERIGNDKIHLSYVSIDQLTTPISKSTFMRGMGELVDKEFLAESIEPTIYFLNPDYIWNGDRLTIVKEFRLKASTPRAKDTLTSDMFLQASQPQGEAA